MYRIDIERDLEVAKRFHVMSIPTVLLFRSGKEVARLDGYISEDDLKVTFERMAVAGP